MSLAGLKQALLGFLSGARTKEQAADAFGDLLAQQLVMSLARAGDETRLSGDVDLAEGEGISITRQGNQLVIAGGGGGGGGGWQTALDVDFTAQPDQTLSPDGSYTIAGLSWSKKNSGNDQVAMALVNGVGLVIQPKANNTDYWGQTRSCPGIWLSFAQIVPDYHPGMAVRLYAHNSANNGAAPYDCAVLAVDPNIDTGASSYGFALKRGFYGGAAGFTGEIHSAGNIYPATNVAAALVAGNAVLMLDVPSISGGSYRACYAAYGDGWPAGTGLTALNGACVSAASVNSSHIAANPMGVRLAALRFASATPLSVTFARLRVDYKP